MINRESKQSLQKQSTWHQYRLSVRTSSYAQWEEFSHAKLISIQYVSYAWIHNIKPSIAVANAKQKQLYPEDYHKTERITWRIRPEGQYINGIRKVKVCVFEAHIMINIWHQYHCNYSNNCAIIGSSFMWRRRRYEISMCMWLNVRETWWHKQKTL